jgi:hypothetical protein
VYKAARIRGLETYAEICNKATAPTNMPMVATPAKIINPTTTGALLQKLSLFIFVRPSVLRFLFGQQPYCLGKRDFLGKGLPEV